MKLVILAFLAIFIAIGFAIFIATVYGAGNETSKPLNQEQEQELFPVQNVGHQNFESEEHPEPLNQEQEQEQEQELFPVQNELGNISSHSVKQNEYKYTLSALIETLLEFIFASPLNLYFAFLAIFIATVYGKMEKVPRELVPVQNGFLNSLLFHFTQGYIYQSLLLAAFSGLFIWYNPLNLSFLENLGISWVTIAVVAVSQLGFQADPAEVNRLKTKLTGKDTALQALRKQLQELQEQELRLNGEKANELQALRKQLQESYRQDLERVNREFVQELENLELITRELLKGLDRTIQEHEQKLGNIDRRIQKVVREIADLHKERAQQLVDLDPKIEAIIQELKLISEQSTQQSSRISEQSTQLQEDPNSKTKELSKRLEFLFEERTKRLEDLDPKIQKQKRELVCLRRKREQQLELVNE